MRLSKKIKDALSRHQIQGTLSEDQRLGILWDNYYVWYEQAASNTETYGPEYPKAFSRAHAKFGYSMTHQRPPDKLLVALQEILGELENLENQAPLKQTQLKQPTSMSTNTSNIVAEAFNAIRDIKPGTYQATTYHLLETLGKIKGMREAIKPVIDGIAQNMLFSDYGAVQVWVRKNKSAVDACEKAAEAILESKAQSLTLGMIAGLAASDEAWDMLEEYFKENPKEAAEFKFDEEKWKKVEKALTISKEFAFDYFFKTFPLKKTDYNA